MRGKFDNVWTPTIERFERAGGTVEADTVNDGALVIGIDCSTRTLSALIAEMPCEFEIVDGDYASLTDDPEKPESEFTDGLMISAGGRAILTWRHSKRGMSATLSVDPTDEQFHRTVSETWEFLEEVRAFWGAKELQRRADERREESAEAIAKAWMARHPLRASRRQPPN